MRRGPLSDARHRLSVGRRFDDIPASPIAIRVHERCVEGEPWTSAAPVDAVVSAGGGARMPGSALFVRASLLVGRRSTARRLDRAGAVTKPG
ncbi:hypothetical protein ACFPM0_11660 [Pseudonocardia sulfidoxydans]|uniref:hypothetical protein n=1 Tax=Pseudonocardia sulfidoxydans TaxID=54011 RepID=UPI00360E9FC6